MENRRRPTIEQLAKAFPHIPLVGTEEGLRLPIKNVLGQEAVVIPESEMEKVAAIRLADRLEELAQSSRY